MSFQSQAASVALPASDRPPLVFVSYAKQDKPFVAKLHTALSSEGIRVWVDWEVQGSSDRTLALRLSV